MHWHLKYSRPLHLYFCFSCPPPQVALWKRSFIRWFMPVDSAVGSSVLQIYFFSSSSSSLFLSSSLTLACRTASSSPWNISFSQVSSSTFNIKSLFTTFRAFLWRQKWGPIRTPGGSPDTRDKNEKHTLSQAVVNSPEWDFQPPGPFLKIKIR